MQRNSVIELQLERWTALLDRLQRDPKVAQLMNTRIGQYLSRHPFLALTAVVFSVMSVLPVGLFLFFSLIAVTVSVAGFVFFEVFLLSVGGLTLLCALSGLALLSILISTIFNICYSTVFSVYNRHIQRKEHKTQENEKEWAL
ncbi:lipid droplet assembly factor 1-like [Genypterus blacodes]|uniref:lipid droplet assembly factor 1-like n=1 Tax=Genypterus blacodes TaxID=154954 RepID=UPI003F75794B